MTNSYLVLSDLHLCDIEDHSDGWKAYKHSRFCFDEELEETLQQFADECADSDRRTLVLNGDIIDFDLVDAVPEDPPWPVSRGERKHGLRPSEEKAVWKLRRVLADHRLFGCALARFLNAGDDIVYILGNHDREFHFPAVKAALLEEISHCATMEGIDIDCSRIRFEPWFYYIPGEIYVEHGQQYDYYTSFRYVLEPVISTADPPLIALPMGNLSNRRLMSQMGFFNPHATDYILNIYRYAAHWLRHYAFSRRGIAINWLVGSIEVMAMLLRTKRQMMRHPPDQAKLIAEQSERSGVSVDKLEALDKLKRVPITNRWYRVVREFWVDRLAIGTIMAGGTIALALLPVPLWVKLMVPLSSFPLLFLIYEWFAHGENVFTHEKEARVHAQKIADLLPSQLVVFGHSHEPVLMPLRRGLTYVNTGTWAPRWRRADPKRLTSGLRNVLTATFEDGGASRIRLDSRLQ